MKLLKLNVMAVVLVLLCQQHTLAQEKSAESSLFTESNQIDANLGNQDITISFGGKKHYTLKDQPEYIYQAMLIDLNRQAGHSFAKALGSYEKALQYMLQAAEYVEVYNQHNWPLSIHNKIKYIDIYNDIATIYKSLNKPKQVKDYYLKALKLAEDYSLQDVLLVEFYEDIAQELRIAGFKEDAFSAYQKAYEHYKKLDGKEGMLDTLVAMAIASTGQAKYDHYHKAQKLAESLRDYYTLATVNNGLAYTYAKDGKFKKALPMAEKALKFFENKKEYSIYPAILDTVGYIHYGLGNLAEAEKHLKLAIQYNSQQYQNTRYYEALGNNHKHLGDVYIKQLQFDKACEQWTLASDHYQKTGNAENIKDIQGHLTEKGCLKDKKS